MRRAAISLALGAAMALSFLHGTARAGTFDDQGDYVPSPDAVVIEDFHLPTRYLPDDADPKCADPMFTLEAGDDALDGTSWVRVKVGQNCAERFAVTLPQEKGSYRATVWTRHGALSAQMVVLYTDESGLALTTAAMFPTGRSTSDGWVELATNEFPVDGTQVKQAYIKTVDLAADDGVDLDALEIVRAGDFVPQQSCHGRSDPVCGPERVCIYERCQLGREFVPPLPDASMRDEVVDYLADRLHIYYGGKRSRAIYLPTALATIESMRKAPTAWAFWNAWAIAIRELHDWHTSASTDIVDIGSTHRLNACFIEGDADASHATWPKDPRYADVLVSHAGSLGAVGLHAGDRLVAVDGMHPLAWATSLVDVDWDYHAASDPDSFADFAERMGGGTWSGGALILRYAKELTVIRCDPGTGTCSPVPETIQVADLPNEVGDADVACDNRPFYHLGQNGPDPTNHYVYWSFFRGRVDGTTDEEGIYGMVWDTLYGGGDPNGYVNSNIRDAYTDFRANARGVILDHRAGNGGTLDAAELVTSLVRPTADAAVIRMPIEIAADDGPKDAADGVAIFDKFKAKSAYTVGSDDWDPDLPVALIIHRDGSASDYMPFGMKGAPHVKIFGPHQTSGAFSTFVDFTYWSGLSYQIASGDTIAADGRALIGHGVEPDVVMLPRQSDLLAGKDTLHEAALAWLRQELAP